MIMKQREKWQEKKKEQKTTIDIEITCVSSKTGSQDI